MEHTGIVLDLVQDWIPPEGLQTLFQTLLQPLGFDLVQLRLANDHGMVVDWESVPGMPYHRNHNDNDTSTRSYYYTPMDLQRIAGVANEVGLQVVPELSVTTNAGGWYKAGGVLANCPKTLCQRGHGIAHDVLGDNEYDTTTNNYWLPIVLAVLHELRHIFSASEYLHLGWDERHASEACLEEAASGIMTTTTNNHTTKYAKHWDRLERKLSAALEFQGVDLEKVLRWDNQERVYYPNRTGRITQYTSRAAAAAVAAGTVLVFFGTIRLQDFSSPWEIYQETREWVQLAPKGLLAQVRPGHPELCFQLVAFAMGMSPSSSSLPVKDHHDLEEEQSVFWRNHRELCTTLGCKHKRELLGPAPPLTKESDLLAQGCRDRTVNVTLRKARVGASKKGLEMNEDWDNPLVAASNSQESRT
jgi:hypothetical protein